MTKHLILLISPRLILLTLSVLGYVAATAAAAFGRNEEYVLVAALFGGLSALGAHDLLQTKHSILRSYPIAGRLRFILEEIRPAIRQYFFADDKDGRPFSRDKRAVVYQRAKMNVGLERRLGA